MKNRKILPVLPPVTKEGVLRHLPKTKAILLRLSQNDKDTIDAAAKCFHLTTTEYLVKCHELVSSKFGS